VQNRDSPQVVTRKKLFFFFTKSIFGYAIYETVLGQRQDV